MDKMSRIVLIVSFCISATLSSVQSMDCQDNPYYAAKCPEWARYGECTRSAGFMKMFCLKSCNGCPMTYPPSAARSVSRSYDTGYEEENTAVDCASPFTKSGETYCAIAFKSQRLSFNDAKELCRLNDAALPVILTEEDQQNLYDIRETSVGKKPIWLGGTFSKDSFEWTDGTPLHLGFQNWHHGQPNKFFGVSLNCMTLHFKGKWNGENCNSRFTVICEKCLTCDDTTSATPTTTAAPRTTAAPTTTAAPPTTAAPTTTAAPPTTAAPTTTPAPPTTAAPTTGGGIVDPHAKGKQCVDVSSHTFPTWVKQDKECCKTVYKKHIYQRNETVCSNVTTFNCDVLPYTECEHKHYEEEVSTSHWTHEYKPVYTCVKKHEEIVHTKVKPVCTKKPKQICNSKWTISPSGEKVWAGNEGCKTIYVDDCKLQEVPEVIKVEKPICTDTDHVPFLSIIPKKEIKHVYKMECKVLKKVHCEAHTTRECVTIEYTESEDKPLKTCDPTYVQVPTQEEVHKKKCLFDADQDTNQTNRIEPTKPDFQPRSYYRRYYG